jgi:anti-sigma regulatory factor (Ser/Thr protein kinase)
MSLIGTTFQAAGPVLDQRFDRTGLPALRAAVRSAAVRTGLPAHRIWEITIAVHELAANAIRHGTGCGRLRIWAEGNELRCQVDDSAAAALTAADASRPGEDADPGWPVQPGHGLWIVRQMADRMRLTTGPGGSRAEVIFTLLA